MIQERHFASIDEVLAHCETEVSAPHLRDYFQLDGITQLWTKGGVLMPSITSPFSSPYLYRGQAKRWRPCVPGVFRGLPLVEHPHQLSTAEWVRCLVDRVKLEEFVAALNDHPALAYAKETGLRTSPYGLAQHYELATDRMDLTQDHRVAAFFATNTCENGVWSPVSEGQGVLYRLHTVSFSQHFGEQLECLGKHALPRPGEQRAYTLTLPLGMDFEALPLEVYTFPQIAACSARLHAHFDGGANLFPHDVLADVAAVIRSDATVPRSILESLMRASLPAEEAIAAVARNESLIGQRSAFRVSNRIPHALSAHQLQQASTTTERLRSTFLFGTGTLAVRRVKPEERTQLSTG